METSLVSMNGILLLWILEQLLASLSKTYSPSHPSLMSLDSLIMINDILASAILFTFPLFSFVGAVLIAGALGKLGCR